MFYLPNKNLIVLKDYTKFKHNIMKYQISGTNHGGKVYVHEQNNYLHLSYNTLRAEIELKKKIQDLGGRYLDNAIYFYSVQ